MGIDRLVMFLTNNYSIKEVLAFPMMKEDKTADHHKSSDAADGEAQPGEANCMLFVPCNFHGPIPLTLNLTANK